MEKEKKNTAGIKTEVKNIFCGRGIPISPPAPKAKIYDYGGSGGCICFPTYDYGDYFCFLNLCVVQSSKAFT